MSKQLLLGVDGGGSTTRAWIVAAEDVAAEGDLAPDSLDVLGRGEAGASNPSSLEMSAVREAIQAAVSAAVADAGLHLPSDLTWACLGLTGVGRNALRYSIQSWAAETIGLNTLVVTDADLVLHAADPHGVGVALIAGTGSFAFGRDEHNQLARAGGWGRLLGDQGGGYAIALDAFRRIAKQFDEQADESRLARAALDYYSVTDPRAFRAQVFSSQPARIAAFAPHVLKLAKQDETAEEIVAAHARELASLVRNVTRQLRLPPDATLAIAGGLLTNNPEYRDRVEAEFDADLPPLRRKTVPEPVVGALRIAKQLSENSKA